MSERLGYTFYPKDFISDPDVMMMTSSQRGIYRDLIDIAYLSDNKIKYSLVQLAKYTNSTEQEVEEILKLKAKKLDNYYSIPSCDKRIKKAATNRENGSKGGRPIKPKKNPEHNPNNNPAETQTKRQREREEEREEENKDNYFNQETFLKWFNECRIYIKLPSNIKKLSRNEQLLFSELKNTYTKDDFKKAFNGFSKDHFFKENNLLFPSHFLREENFTKFLNYKELTLGEKLAGKC